jgi:hypothetical protein
MTAVLRAGQHRGLAAQLAETQKIIADAVAGLGQPDTIARAFTTFQQHLCQPLP